LRTWRDVPLKDHLQNDSTELPGSPEALSGN